MSVRARLALPLLLAAAAACRSASYREKEALMPLASRLTKLTAAVESAVAFKKTAPAGARDLELVRLATAHDPGLAEPFARHALRAEARDGHALLLLCSEDGARALFEDAGCTAQVDRHHWEAPAPCAFTLSVRDACR